MNFTFIWAAHWAKSNVVTNGFPKRAGGGSGFWLASGCYDAETRQTSQGMQRLGEWGSSSSAARFRLRIPVDAVGCYGNCQSRAEKLRWRDLDTATDQCVLVLQAIR